jgi:hypothetical protein
MDAMKRATWTQPTTLTLAVYSQTHFETNYAELVRWTKTMPHAPRSCFVTFGQNLSYFACATGYGSVWAGIPSELEDKLRKTFDTPSCVALGSKNAWAVIYPDGFIAWKFYGHYSALDKILKEAVPRSVAVRLRAASTPRIYD